MEKEGEKSHLSEGIKERLVIAVRTTEYMDMIITTNLIMLVGSGGLWCLRRDIGMINSTRL